MLRVRQHSLAPGHVHYDVAWLNSLDSNWKDFADSLDELLIHQVALGFPETLHDDLFCSLGRDTTRAVGDAAG